MGNGAKIGIALGGLAILGIAYYFIFYKKKDTVKVLSASVDCKDYGNLSNYDKKWCRDNGMGINVQTVVTGPIADQIISQD